MSKVAQLLLFIAGVLLAWGLWLGEVLWLKGWPGLAWLRGFQWSSLPICALIALMASYAVTDEAVGLRRTLFVAGSFVLTMAAFLLGRIAAFDLFAGGFPSGFAKGPLLLLLLGWGILPIGLPVLARMWLFRLRRWAPFALAVLMPLAIVLALLTIKILPAVNGSTDQIHAFKMGYPVLWLAALIPVALRLSRRQSGERLA